MGDPPSRAPQNSASRWLPRDWRGWVWVAIAVLTALPWVTIPLDNADGSGMMAHLQGFFRDFDLLYDDDYAQFGMLPLFAYVTPQGVVSNHWPIGATFVQAPGYLMGRAAGGALGFDNHTIPLLGVRTWALALLWVAAAGIRRWVGGHAGLMAAAAFVLATPALYYAAEAPSRPHLYGAVVMCAVAWMWHSGIGNTSRARLLLLSATCGLAVAIRPQLAPLCLLVAEVAWRDAPADDSRIKRTALAAVAFLPWPLVVLSLHAWMYGGGLLGYSGGEVTHHLGHFLFSTFHGVLPWTPIVLVGLFGFAVGIIRRERGAALLLALFVMQLWIDSGSRPVYPGHVIGSRTWSGGTAFGPRKLLDAMPLLLPTVFWIRDWASSRGRQIAVALAVAICAIPPILLFFAAFVDPKTTEAVLDGTGYLRALTRGLEPDAWSRVLAARGMPLRVPLALLVGVSLPVAGGLWAVRRISRSRRPYRNAAVTVLGLGVAALLWNSALQVRTDGLIADDPERMVRAAETMWEPHVRMLEQATAYRAMVRERLGEGAAPL